MKRHFQEINWEAQWALFAQGYADGIATINIGNDSFTMAPGGGFGDLSHPTTRLMLELMKGRVHGHVLDIGCGSGILSLAAAKMGAGSVEGIDIDPAAVAHAQKNGQLNQLNLTFSEQWSGKHPDLILMNMIMCEQKVAWDEKYEGKVLITSGILAEQRDSYLAMWNWELIAEKEEEGWLGFVLGR